MLFAAWTLFVWGGRLRNLWLEPGSLTEVSRWSLAGAVLFTALGLALVVAVVFGRARRAVVGALGAITVAVWAVRGIDIALGDHSIGFIVVHLALAVISMVLAAWAWRSTNRPGAQPGQAEGIVGYAAVDG